MKRSLFISAVLALAGALSACGSSQSPTVTVTTSVAATTTSTWSQSSQDETFLAQSSLIDGFETTSRADSIAMAHQVCTAFQNHIQGQVLQILSDSYGINSATEFMHTAVSVYCPEQLSS